VAEFEQEIGQKPPRCRVACLCFDKLDVEKGMEVRSPKGETRTLKHPWSILAYQLAGDQGLMLLNADGKPEERETPQPRIFYPSFLHCPCKRGWVSRPAG
jgi:hypothetical protein